MWTSPRCCRPTCRRSASTTSRMRRAARRRCCRRIWPRRERSARPRSAIRASRPAATHTRSGRISRRTSISRACRSARSAACAPGTRFPVDGEYEFQVRLYRTNLSAIRGLEDPHELELTLDGEPILHASIGGEKDLIGLQTNPTDTSDALEASRLRVRRVVKAGQRDVPRRFSTRRHRSSRPIGCSDSSATSRTLSMPKARRTSSRSPFKVRSARRRQARRRARASSSAGRRRGLSEAACARRILSTLATQAYRRPLSDAEIDDLVRYYAQAKGGGTFQDGVQFGLRRILASPSFVFRPEAEPASLPPARRIASPTSSWRRGSRSSSGAACPTRR